MFRHAFCSQNLTTNPCFRCRLLLKLLAGRHGPNPVPVSAVCDMLKMPRADFLKATIGIVMKDFAACAEEKELPGDDEQMQRTRAWAAKMLLRKFRWDHYPFGIRYRVAASLLRLKGLAERLAGMSDFTLSPLCLERCLARIGGDVPEVKVLHAVTAAVREQHDMLWRILSYLPTASVHSTDAAGIEALAAHALASGAGKITQMWQLLGASTDWWCLTGEQKRGCAHRCVFIRCTGGLPDAKCQALFPGDGTPRLRFEVCHCVVAARQPELLASLSSSGRPSTLLRLAHASILADVPAALEQLIRCGLARAVQLAEAAEAEMSAFGWRLHPLAAAAALGRSAMVQMLLAAGIPASPVSVCFGARDMRQQKPSAISIAAAAVCSGDPKTLDLVLQVHKPASANCALASH